MRKQFSALIGLSVVLVLAQGLQAAFMVEVYSNGRGYANFSSGAAAPNYSATQSKALGLTGTKSAYGNSGAFPDIYTYSYTPGTDADNWVVPEGQDFGNGDITTGLAGGQSGYYNIYVTWPASTNVTSLCDITVTCDGDPVVITGVNMNTGGTGTPGAINAWWKIADSVYLTAGTTYTVTQAAQKDGFVSMRSSGVMWELVSVPEPATLFLLGSSALFLRKRKA